VLSINIKAIDPYFQLLQMRRSGKSATGLYFDGLTVDDHGNIRPVRRTQQQVVLPLDEARVEIEKQLLADYFKGS
jgi:polysaccharide export outer membrane protein